MTPLEQIDSDLREWDHKLRIAGDNLLELSRSVSYQRLLGEANWPKAQLSGATADRAQPAIAGLHALWIYHALLHDTIDRAKKLRESVSALLPSRNLLGQLDRLLHGPSIELPAATTPLQQRDLATPVEMARAVEPERVLARMNQLFQDARDVVLAIGAAWEELPQQFLRFEAELSRLAGADGSFPNEIAAARGRLAVLGRQFDADPLNALDGSRAWPRKSRPLPPASTNLRKSGVACPAICSPRGCCSPKSASRIARRRRRLPCAG